MWAGFGFVEKCVDNRHYRSRGLGSKVEYSLYRLLLMVYLRVPLVGVALGWVGLGRGGCSALANLGHLTHVHVCSPKVLV